MKNLIKWFKKINHENEEIIDRFREFKNILPHDDWTLPWLFFLSVNPLSSKYQKLFDKQTTTSGKIGIASRWLIKVAKKKKVSQALIDLYCEYKNKDLSRFDRSIEIFSERINEENRTVDGLISDHKLIESFETQKNVHERNFFQVTTKLIEETL